MPPWLPLSCAGLGWACSAAPSTGESTSPLGFSRMSSSLIVAWIGKRDIWKVQTFRLGSGWISRHYYDSCQGKPFELLFNRPIHLFDFVLLFTFAYTWRGIVIVFHAHELALPEKLQLLWLSVQIHWMDELLRSSNHEFREFLCLNWPTKIPLRFIFSDHDQFKVDRILHG